MNFVYIQLLKYLHLLRETNKGKESLAEDELCDTMDLVWGLMSEEDIKGLESYPLFYIRKPMKKRIKIKIKDENLAFIYDTSEDLPLDQQIRQSIGWAKTDDILTAVAISDESYDGEVVR